MTCGKLCLKDNGQKQYSNERLSNDASTFAVVSHCTDVQKHCGSTRPYAFCVVRENRLDRCGFAIDRLYG